MYTVESRQLVELDSSNFFFIPLEILVTLNFDKFELDISNNTYLEATFYPPSTSSCRRDSTVCNN